MYAAVPEDAKTEILASAAENFLRTLGRMEGNNATKLFHIR